MSSRAAACILFWTDSNSRLGRLLQYKERCACSAGSHCSNVQIAMRSMSNPRFEEDPLLSVDCQHLPGGLAPPCAGPLKIADMHAYHCVRFRMLPSRSSLQATVRKSRCAQLSTSLSKISVRAYDSAACHVQSTSKGRVQRRPMCHKLRVSSPVSMGDC